MYRPPGRFPPGRPVRDERGEFFERERGFERSERAYDRVPVYDERGPPEDPAMHKVGILSLLYVVYRSGGKTDNTTLRTKRRGRMRKR